MRPRTSRTDSIAVLRLGQRALRVGLEEPAGLGQLDAAAGADEQRDAELGLEPADLLREARLGDQERVGGGAERPVFGRREEVGELLKCHIGVSYRPCSQSSLKQFRTSVVNRDMIAFALIVAAAVGSFFAAEDRPGFSEKAPLT